MCTIIASTDLPFRFSSNARGATRNSWVGTTRRTLQRQPSTPYIRRRTATTTYPKPVPTFPLRFLVGAFPPLREEKKKPLDLQPALAERVTRGGPFAVLCTLKLVRT
ncbi:hypothetical protein JTE90_013001 [Oedothorax gibbosus]|uniref:Uncharacterized protein n=1 Tax=Oedothorax gibbosus TaxID=931172 RepID=A0AAV6TFX0_9ARAC|nr:hypothetical protein JTE90_013001 [Oedothorax gibbosus]